LRIGQVSKTTGLSVRMIRYYETHGWIKSTRTSSPHRRYTSRDVYRLGMLRALLAAGIAPDRAVRALNNELPPDELAKLRHMVIALAGQTAEAAQHLAPATVESPNFEEPDRRMAVTFDTFVLRVRVDSLLTKALRPVGITSGEYAMLSLLVVEDGLTPPAITRLVGNAPSTVTSRLDKMQQQGWIERTVNPDAKGSWRIELTEAGRRRFEAAFPYAQTILHRLYEALADAGVDSAALRDNLTKMSSVVRSLL
jgi:DNA-binding transcriptional MerR regulator/DNA-binding MarR family transcriptional regulator